MKTNYLFYLVCSFILLHGVYVKAQNIEWAAQIGGLDADFVSEIKVDPMGNIIIIGVFEGVVDFDPGPEEYNLISTWNKNTFILKLNPSGDFLWAKQQGASLNGYGHSITFDYLGNIYITGYFYETADLDPGPGIHTATGTGDEVYIQKLDPSGNLIWVKIIGGTGYDRVGSIAVDESGNVYTSGFYHEKADFDPGVDTFYLSSQGDSDFFISKLDSSGNFVWAKSFGGPDVDASGQIKIDGNGNIFITGYFYETADFDPGPGFKILNTEGMNDIFILKLNPAGDFVWVKQMGGTSIDAGYSLAIDDSDNIYCTGFYGGNVDFDPGVGVYELNSQGIDGFIQKLDNDGNLLWAQTIGGLIWDRGHCVGLDKFGNIYITGHFQDTVDFDQGPDSIYLSSNGQLDIFTLKLDPCGNFVWADQKGGIGMDDGIFLSLDTFGNVYVTGNFQGEVDFGSDSNMFNFTAGGFVDGFVFKLNQDNFAQNITTSNNEGFFICEGEVLDLTANGGVSYNWNTGDTTATIQVSPLVTTTYFVTITNAVGCSLSQYIEIMVEPMPDVQFDYQVNENVVDFNNLSSGNNLSFEWDFGDSSGSNEQNPVHEYQEPGIYIVTLTATNSFCESIFTQTVEVIFTSTKVIEEDEKINLFPNPVNSQLNFTSKTNIENIQISNYLGQNLITIIDPENQAIIDVNHLPNGIYTITFKTKKFFWTSQFLKE